jgi:hypothetical protein
MKILLVVDREDYRLALREAAAAEGLEVLEPLASAEIEAAAREFSPELAVVSSEREEPRELAALLRSLPGRFPCRVLVCESAERGAPDADGDPGVLPMPLPVPALRARLRRAADSWGRPSEGDIAEFQEKLKNVSRFRHDINNLLFVVTGNIEWLRTASDLNSPEAHECLNDAFESVQQLKSVIHGLGQPRGRQAASERAS